MSRIVLFTSIVLLSTATTFAATRVGRDQFRVIGETVEEESRIELSIGNQGGVARGLKGTLLLCFPTEDCDPVAEFVVAHVQAGESVLRVLRVAPGSVIEGAEIDFVRFDDTLAVPSLATEPPESRAMNSDELQERYDEPASNAYSPEVHSGPSSGKITRAESITQKERKAPMPESRPGVARVDVSIETWPWATIDELRYRDRGAVPGAAIGKPTPLQIELEPGRYYMRLLVYGRSDISRVVSFEVEGSGSKIVTRSFDLTAKEMERLMAKGQR